MAEEIVGSKLPQFASDTLKKPSDNTKTGYGQNGYTGASSDTDLSNPTRSALSVELFPSVDLKGALDKAGLPHREPIKRSPPVDYKQPKFDAPQTRTVKADSYPLSMGMAQRSPRNR
jgi:hypothetical protein